MGEQDLLDYTAFEGSRCIARGNLLDVAEKVKQVMDGNIHGPILIFNDFTGETVEMDFRGTTTEVINRLKKSPLMAGFGTLETQRLPEEPKGPGRPKLGVVSREVTLLPRHWEWLNGQPGGASVALRKLVEGARKTYRNRDRIRLAREATYRFMDAFAGNLPGFEEATRALFAGNRDRLHDLMGSWPQDIGAYAKKLSEPSFQIQDDRVLEKNEK
jgi:hypothetical protein